MTTTIHLRDESLHPILKGSTVSFDAEKGLPVDYPAFTPAQELLVTILTAVQQRDTELQLSNSYSE